MNLSTSRGRLLALVGGVAASVACCLTAQAVDPAKPAPQTVKLTMDPSALSIEPTNKIHIGYMPCQITLSEVKPAGITKEPAYKGKPKYAVIHLGNGPKSAYTVVYDEPAEGDWKVYVDKNQNGDLTDDGDGSWTKKVSNGGRTVYGVNHYILRASYGTATTEVSHADYQIGLYKISSLAATGLMMREGARTGVLTLDGKAHKVLLAENDADALYNKAVDTDATTGKPIAKVLGKPLWLLVDVNDDGKFATTEGSMFDVRAPFKVGEVVYEAKVSADGSTLTVAPTTKAVAELMPPRPKAKPLLASGTDVPEFRAEAWGGGTVQPADYKGKILILDFWATWCGPCQKSMPHIERVYKAVKDKNVTVLAVCVWDDKDSYSKWVPANQAKYTFPLAFDPAGKDNASSIASKLFNVNGIPTTYIIGRDGKVADSIVGYQDGDTRVEDALKKLGVDVSAEATK